MHGGGVAAFPGTTKLTTPRLTSDYQTVTARFHKHLKTHRGLPDAGPRHKLCLIWQIGAWLDHRELLSWAAFHQTRDSLKRKRRADRLQITPQIVGGNKPIKETINEKMNPFCISDRIALFFLLPQHHNHHRRHLLLEVVIL